MLLSTHIPERYAEQVAGYVQASSTLVEALAPKVVEYGIVLEMIIKSLLRMARILCDTSSVSTVPGIQSVYLPTRGQIVPLAGIFNLLATMCLFLPKTTASLLPEEPDEAIPPMLQLVMDVVRVYGSSKDSQPSENELLIRECLNFVEISCLTIPKALLSQ